MYKIVFATLLFSFLGACSTTPNRAISPNISQPPVNDIQLSEVIDQPDRFIDNTVRWGGRILNVESTTDNVTLEIQQRPLSQQGRPLARAKSDGRFIARIPQPYDIRHYYIGRLITINGTIKTPETRELNNQTQQLLPVLSATDHYAWNSGGPYHSHNRYYYHPYNFGYYGYRGYYKPYYHHGRLYRGRGHFLYRYPHRHYGFRFGIHH